MPKRPHILLITSDQHRADTLGVAGHPCVQTPHLDLLAYQGVRYTNCYADCPVCIPARTTLITGRRAHENGMPAYDDRYRVQRDRRDFLGGLLTEAGYQTDLVGKTHWHTEPLFRAGFEHVTWLSELKQQQFAHAGRPGTLVGMGFNEVSPTLSPFPRHLHSTDWCVDQALRFLDTRERDQPFALWVSLIDPHPPLVIHEPYYSMYREAPMPDAVVPDWVGSPLEPWEHFCDRHTWNKGPMTADEVRAARAVYCGMVTNIDHQIGRLIGQLQASGDWADTLVVYSSDHGEALGDLGTLGKRTFFECSAKLPLIIRPPASWERSAHHLPGRVCEDLVEWADLLPTLCDAAGARVPGDVTGRSLLPTVAGERLAPHLMHGQIEGSHMMHDGRFKYLYSTHDGSELCFDIANDPHDQYPLTGEHLERLRAAFIEHLASEQHPHLNEGRPINQEKTRPEVNTLRARDVSGLRAAQYLGDMGRHLAEIH
jgi:arylsulfatase